MPIPTDVLARYNRAISVPHAMGIDYSELLRDMAAEIEQHRTVSACRDAGTMESAVAAAARAICKERFLNGGVDTDDGWDSATPEIQGDCLKQARAALTAGVITAITSELIGSVEQERLAKTPWARSLVNDLIRRIANLRAMLAAEHTGQPQEGWRLSSDEEKMFDGALDVAVNLARSENEQHKGLGQIIAGVCAIIHKRIGDVDDGDWINRDGDQDDLPTADDVKGLLSAAPASPQRVEGGVRSAVRSRRGTGGIGPP